MKLHKSVYLAETMCSRQETQLFSVLVLQLFVLAKICAWAITNFLRYERKATGWGIRFCFNNKELIGFNVNKCSRFLSFELQLVPSEDSDQPGHPCSLISLC